MAPPLAEGVNEIDQLKIGFVGQFSEKGDPNKSGNLHEMSSLLRKPLHRE